MHHTLIHVIKKRDGQRQVKYTNFAVGEFQTLSEAKTFAINYEYGLKIEVWEGEECIEEIKKG